MTRADDDAELLRRLGYEIGNHVVIDLHAREVVRGLVLNVHAHHGGKVATINTCDAVWCARGRSVLGGYVFDPQPASPDSGVGPDTDTG